MDLKNRDYPIFSNNKEAIFAECPHCNEPMTYVIKSTELRGLDDDRMEAKCYCRGAAGLSFKIRCCIELKCDIKNKSYCALIQPSKTEYPAKFWNTIVVE